MICEDLTGALGSLLKQVYTLTRTWPLIWFIGHCSATEPCQWAKVHLDTELIAQRCVSQLLSSTDRRVGGCEALFAARVSKTEPVLGSASGPGPTERPWPHPVLLSMERVLTKDLQTEKKRGGAKIQARDHPITFIQNVFQSNCCKRSLGHISYKYTIMRHRIWKTFLLLVGVFFFN